MLPPKGGLKPHLITCTRINLSSIKEIAHVNHETSEETMRIFKKNKIRKVKYDPKPTAMRKNYYFFYKTKYNKMSM